MKRSEKLEAKRTKVSKTRGPLASYLRSTETHAKQFWFCLVSLRSIIFFKEKLANNWSILHQRNNFIFKSLRKYSAKNKIVPVIHILKIYMKINYFLPNIYKIPRKSLYKRSSQHFMFNQL